MKRQLHVPFIISACLLLIGTATGQAVPAQRSAASRTIRLSPPLNSAQMIEAQMQAAMQQAGGTVLPGPAGVQPPGATAAAAGAAFEQQKTQLLQKLTFDRRPSSILRAWAIPEEELLKSDTEQPNPETKPATAVSAEEPKTPDGDADEPAEEQTEEEKAAEAAAEAAAAAAAEAAAKARQQAEEQQRKLKEFQDQIRRLQLMVTKGQWPAIAEEIAAFSETERKTIFNRMLASLIEGPPDAPRTRSRQIIGEQNLLKATDVIAIAELCPEKKLTRPQIVQIGQLVRACQKEGEADYAFFEAIRDHVGDDSAEKHVSRRIAAQILFAANRADEAMDFLPTLQEAQAKKDLQALDLLSDTFLALHRKEAEAELLENAWAAIQSILEADLSAGEEPVADQDPQADADAPPAETATAAIATDDQLSTKEKEQLQQKALKQAVKLVPRLREALGQKWLADSFTRDAERGRRILNGIGTAAARNMAENGYNTNARLETLKLQQTAVESVLEHAGESTADWSAALHLMAINWLREAVYSSLHDTSSSRGPRMSRDVYGNYFWSDQSAGSGRQVQNGMPQPVPSGKLLDTRPSDQWLEFLEPTFSPTLAMATARLHLRVKEEAEAFPFIESLAETHPEEARELVRNFLTTWGDNHDPNSERRRTSVYMFSFGFNQRLSGIPLTRSHQERNLKELAGWVARIRALPLTDIDDKWIASAFTRVHSAAEVYRLDDLEAVFGDADSMESDTLASLLLTMRGNLSSVWRMPQVQQDANTNRKKKDIEAEVTAGYDTALSLCEKALQKTPDHWKLLMVKGSLLHDLNNYRNDMEKSTSYTEKRKEALQLLQQSAAAYVNSVGDLKETEYTVEPFNTWFYATLGDSQIGQITPQRNPMLDQIARIEETLNTLPEEALTIHRDKFSNDLFSRMSSVNPAVKFRYVREGLKLAGDRMQAREARQVFDYYNDLVTEIQLKAELDGTPRVGHGQPFGVLVSLRHTKAIERESGGFSRYLQNQNSGGGYFYNNGRPNEDYRDKFEQATRDAVDEHFEVLSVTFEPEKVNSRPDPELGWRVTPYAYVLLKARGPEVDRIPPMRLDLDFLDTTGYVILPVETASISVDCSDERGDSRPLSNLALTQTLDEREAKDGRLVLEIKATGQGIVPELNELVDLSFENFKVGNIDDNALSVSRFDPDSPEPVVLSERLWTVTLADREAAGKRDATQFSFPAPLLDTHEVVYQRYDDADLQAVDQIVTLEQTYDKPDNSGLIQASLGVLAVIVVCVVVFIMVSRRRSATQQTTTTEWVMPKEVTPFSVLALLKQIERNNGLSPQSQDDLADSITRIERFYFAASRESSEPDLANEARTWVGKAR
jgi:hypothetical protein